MGRAKGSKASAPTPTAAQEADGKAGFAVLVSGGVSIRNALPPIRSLDFIKAAEADPRLEPLLLDLLTSYDPIALGALSNTLQASLEERRGAGPRHRFVPPDARLEAATWAVRILLTMRRKKMDRRHIEIRRMMASAMTDVGRLLPGPLRTVHHTTGKLPPHQVAQSELNAERTPSNQQRQWAADLINEFLKQPPTYTELPARKL